MRFLQAVCTFFAVLIGYIIWSAIGGIIGFLVGGFTATILAGGVAALFSKSSGKPANTKPDAEADSKSEPEA